MRSVSRSALLAAAAAVTLADIRFTLTLPGLSAPNVSWVILPMAPTGVVSVSPVTRHATSASANDSSTASAVCQYGMPNARWPSQASPTNAATWPPTNHEAGASSAATTPPHNVHCTRLP